MIVQFLLKMKDLLVYMRKCFLESDSENVIVMDYVYMYVF
ncbi:MAG: hypothetical protein P857_157 [Candidatus Xenolissoclinum pacificiensis L6]|uniref:Uncharacterized protein n=1 Tax=Candidatus Xenolissoclinum pacificiensis L6 TaxID=1401685 RepID=W2V0A3_9RICK|nr:MAG: hypothetical protein P857_157 [Candidatus Xenolissoclinum pacificiensis L6]